jgi:hypothetical protein
VKRNSGIKWEILLAALLSVPCVRAQGNYEVQVYGSEIVDAGKTMVELHSNFTVQGSKSTSDGALPTNHQLHETIEITHGWNKWFETGYYIFTSADSNNGWQWVGSHLRPRVRAPESWHWPVGVSLSTEIGYQRALFSPDTWTLEIRPIVDKQLGKLYLGFNPALERSLHGPSVGKGVEFSPNFKAGYQVSKRVSMGVEYYSSLGSITGFDPLRDQEQQFIPCVDLDLGENWEFNFGVGVGATGATDHLLIKMILGRRFSFGRH